MSNNFWTPSYLAFVLPLTAEQVLQAGGPQGGHQPGSVAEWRWIQTAQRLVWQYGFADALTRLNRYFAGRPHD